MTDPQAIADGLSEAHHHHIDQTRTMFRACGFDLGALQYPRSEEALVGLKQFNRVPPDWKHPVSWGYFPNAYMRDNWQRYYPVRAILAKEEK